MIFFWDPSAVTEDVVYKKTGAIGGVSALHPSFQGYGFDSLLESESCRGTKESEGVGVWGPVLKLIFGCTMRAQLGRSGCEVHQIGWNGFCELCIARSHVIKGKVVEWSCGLRPQGE